MTYSATLVGLAEHDWRIIVLFFRSPFLDFRLQVFEPLLANSIESAFSHWANRRFPPCSPSLALILAQQSVTSGDEMCLPFHIRWITKLFLLRRLGLVLYHWTLSILAEIMLFGDPPFELGDPWLEFYTIFNVFGLFFIDSSSPCPLVFMATKHHNIIIWGHK